MENIPFFLGFIDNSWCMMFSIDNRTYKMHVSPASGNNKQLSKVIAGIFNDDVEVAQIRSLEMCSLMLEKHGEATIDVILVLEMS